MTPRVHSVTTSILTNPPFGTRGANQAPDRDDFVVATSNKQLNFIQHVMTILKRGGRVAMVVPDNVLFADRAAEVFKMLMEDCDLHTVLRCPRGTFSPYSEGTQTYVIFFTKGRPTEQVWIYDARAGVPKVTKRMRPLTAAHFEEFERCFGSDPNGQSPRSEADSADGRWRVFSRDEVERHHYELDSFKWLRDDDATDSDDAPDPDDLITEAVGALRLALDDLAEMQQLLEGNGSEIDFERHSSLARVTVAERALSRLRQAVLAAACSGRLTADWRQDNDEPPPQVSHASTKTPKRLRPLDSYTLDEIPDNWRWMQVEDILPKGGIFDGPFGSNLKTADYTATGARVVRLENIGHLHFIDSKQTFVPVEKYQSLAKHAVFPGDVVFSSFVEEQIRVCVLPENLPEMTLAKADCFTLRPEAGIYPPYLALQLASPATYRNLVGHVHGATRPRVNTTQVRSLPVAVCSEAEQREVVRRFERLMSLADRVIGRDAA